MTYTVTMTGNQSVTATFSQVFTDPTIVAQQTSIKASHISDLRSAVRVLE